MKKKSSAYSSGDNKKQSTEAMIFLQLSKFGDESFSGVALHNTIEHPRKPGDDVIVQVGYESSF